ncbi:MAG: cobyrinate a,c-diamide synthase, partial [Thermodesulfobacteriota bacterium]
MQQAGFVVAGTHSGCGKTSVALGLMAALSQKGFKVQPFKVGPDFIDPGHHTRITGRQSYNLDGWMLSREYNHDLFRQGMKDADVAVVEGVMGLFDGFSGKEESGSTAQIAKWLDLPVLLVVDAKSMARSAAALALGYCSFDQALNLNKLIFNRVGSPAHMDILQDAMQSLPGIEVIAHLPREENIAIPSRHLGLVTNEDLQTDEDRIDSLAKWIGQNLDLDLLIERFEIKQDKIPGSKNSSQVSFGGGGSDQNRFSGLRIAVARDEAFCFYYPDNLELLQEMGAEIACFSPLRDAALPEDISGIYLGGGYPELNAKRLSENTELKTQILDFADRDNPIYAECGGFMYLMQELEDVDANKFPMVGIFDLRARMENRFRALGYREIQIARDSILGSKDTV